MSARFRFAPSPTGNLHIGGARTALFNYLAARASRGQFLLRIEDTDLERSTEAFTQNILDGMQWLELKSDEPVYYQSKNTARYEAALANLLERKIAYRCYCPPELLDQKRQAAMKEGRKPKYDGTCRNLRESDYPVDKPFCVRVRFPDSGETTYQDIFRGSIVTPNSEMDDLIIRRSDCGYSYNFAVVIDDSHMSISHVLRGDDHINNTPRQIILYRLLGLEPPQFGHFPMILGADKKRLSKRHGATAVTDYRQKGFLPMALINFLVRLGWSYGDQELFFSMEDLISKFNLKSIGKSPAVFNEEKLLWINQQHLKQLSPEDALTKSFELNRENVPASIGNPDLFKKLIGEIKERSRTLLELREGVRFLFERPSQVEEEGQKKFMTADRRSLFEETRTALRYLSEWNETNIQFEFNRIAAEHQVKMVALAQPLRLIVTGKAASPSLFLIMAVLGKAEILLRLEGKENLFQQADAQHNVI